MVSIVIPSYNRRSFLSDCLESLRTQSYSNYEVIVVDDGSTDDTIEFLRAFTKTHPDFKIFWVVNENNLGANVARNAGVREAKGEFVAFLDSDCITKNNWLTELMKGFVSDEVASVTGLVETVKPRNIYELAYKGSCRVHGIGKAPRLVAGNMCIRHSLLLKYPFEEDLKYGCDEEGLYLRLRAAGYRQRFIDTAIVLHNHPFTRKSFFRRAWILGKSAAWLVYKYHLFHRIDLLPFIITYLLLPVGLLDYRLLLVPLFFFTTASAALFYNELFRKRKTVKEALTSFPILLIYYHIRLIAYIIESLRLRLSRNSIERVRLR
jgi:glycosyltransferase involved in cell wall biosynthesis